MIPGGYSLWPHVAAAMLEKRRLSAYNHFVDCFHCAATRLRQGSVRTAEQMLVKESRVKVPLALGTDRPEGTKT